MARYMASADVEFLVERLAIRLARIKCDACGGNGMHPWEGGPCPTCDGAKVVPLAGKAREAWMEAATQEVEAHCLDCENWSESIVPKGGVRL